jgi:hypothetical protein
LRQKRELFAILNWHDFNATDRQLLASRFLLVFMRESKEKTAFVPMFLAWEKREGRQKIS